MKKQKVKKEKVKKSKQGWFHRLKEEMKHVKWPSFKEIIKYTIATIVLCIIIALLFQSLNLLVSFVKGLFN